MSATPVKLLLIEDNPGDALLVQATLAEDAPGEFDLTCVERLTDALARIRAERFDVVLSDLGLPDSRGLAAVEALSTCAPALPLVVLTGTSSEDLGPAAIRDGAQDYLVKGKSSAQLIVRTLHYAIERKRLENALRMANETLEQRVAERTAELEKTASALRDSEARFRSLTAMSSDFYWESDAEHRLTQRASAEWKSSTVSLFQRGEQIGKRRWDLPHVSPDAAGWAAHRALLDAHQPFRNFELSRQGTDGAERFISISGDPVFDAAGKFTGYRGVGTDITERVRAERELRAREARYRAVANSANDAFITSDGAGYVVGWNPAAERLFGYTEAEAIGQPLTLLMPQRLQAQHLAGMQRAQSGEALRLIGKAAELTGRRKDGSEFPLELSLAEWTVAEGRFFTGIIRDLSGRKAAEAQAQRYLKQLETAFMSTVGVATSLSEMRDPYTAGHERRVGEIAAAIGAELGLDAQRVEGLRVAGHLHDIGKIIIPAEILSKPGKLSAIEYELIKAHPRSGYDVLKTVEFPWPVAEVALQHHERLDGSGYPLSLKGEAIILEARITAVADVMEAMSSHRPYRPGLGIDKALAEIERGRGSVYDAGAADACLKLFREKGYTIPA